MQLQIQKLLTDGRHFQIAFQSSFIIYGIMFLGWDTDPWRYFTIFTFCLLTQYFGTALTGGSHSAFKSGFISALGLSILFKANHYETLALCAAISVGSKFLIRYNGKHIFNPTNFGMIICMLLTGDAWISPGQWGNSATLLFLVGAMGGMVVLKVGRMDTAFAFIGTLLGLQFLRSIVFLQWPVDFLLHSFSSGSLLLFAFFMITDPMTSPNHQAGRIVWAAMVAALSFYMSNFLWINAAPIWALFFMSPLVPFIDNILKDRKFEWLWTPTLSANNISYKTKNIFLTKNATT